MNLEHILCELNINKKEAKIYLASLELGVSGAADIAKKAGIQRTHFYDLTEKLLNLGLLKQLNKGKKRLFYSVKPERLMQIQKERLEKLVLALPEFKALFNAQEKKPRIFYYTGKSGINHINNDTLQYKGEIVGFTTPRFISAYNKKISSQYIAKRVSLGNKVRVIGEMSQEIMELKNKDKNELRETRILPKTIFTSEIEIGAYDNKIFVVDYKQEFGFIIESTAIASTIKMIFEIIWNSGRIII